MNKIEIKGIELLDEEEKQIANKLFDGYYPKIERIAKNDLLLKVHIKEYDKDGKKSKYSINAEAIFSGKMLSSSSWDYDLARAIHKSMKKLETEIEHKFHTSEQH